MSLSDNFRNIKVNTLFLWIVRSLYARRLQLSVCVTRTAPPREGVNCILRRAYGRGRNALRTWPVGYGEIHPSAMGVSSSRWIRAADRADILKPALHHPKGWLSE